MRLYNEDDGGSGGFDLHTNRQSRQIRPLGTAGPSFVESFSKLRDNHGARR